eukprot:scaffold1140_cov60-Cylindrotheca_fusiformis.AAC.1
MGEGQRWQFLLASNGTITKQAGVALVPKGGPSTGPPFGTVPPFSIRFGCYGSACIPLGDSPRPPFCGGKPPHPH